MTRDEPNQVSHLPDDVRQGTYIVIAAYNEGPCIEAVVRDRRPMALNNTGDSIVLINPSGETVDEKSYDQVSSGEIVRFD